MIDGRLRRIKGRHKRVAIPAGVAHVLFFFLAEGRMPNVHKFTLRYSQLTQSLFVHSFLRSIPKPGSNSVAFPASCPLFGSFDLCQFNAPSMLLTNLILIRLAILDTFSWTSQQNNLRICSSAVVFNFQA